MVKLWMPRGVGERYEIYKRLKQGLGVIVPEWQTMDINRLRDILEWQEKKAAEKAAEDAKKPVSKHSREDVRLALRDYRDFLNARKEGRKRIY